MTSNLIKTTNLLILGGTAEALQLSAELANFSAIKTISSLAGRTQFPLLPTGEYRIGGFGGIKGLQEYLLKKHIHAVIDATHPFAQQMQKNIQQSTSLLQIPYLRFSRDFWVSDPQDHWVISKNFLEAVSILEKLSSKRVFLTIGSQNLFHFCQFSNIFFLIRLINPPPQEVPLKNYRLIYDRGPFTKESEKNLLVSHQIDLIVSKNSGGVHTYAKVIAARELHIPILMISPPPTLSPTPPVVTQLEEAINWVKNQFLKEN